MLPLVHRRLIWTKEIYWVRQLSLYSVIVKTRKDDLRNTKGYSLPVMTFEMPSPFAFIGT